MAGRVPGGRNSVKRYDMANVARVEVTTNDPTQFRVLRVKNGHRVWCPMRKGVNLPRYSQVGRPTNGRYLEAVAAVTDTKDASRFLDRHCRPITNQRERHPRLNPVAKEDLALSRAALAGKHLVNGFSNRHVQARPDHWPPAGPAEAKRRCQRTSWLITKLRGRGLIAKVPRVGASIASPATASAAWPPRSPSTTTPSPPPVASSSRAEVDPKPQHFC